MTKYTRKKQKKGGGVFTRKKKVYKQYKVNDVITEKNTVIKCPMCHNDKFLKTKSMLRGGRVASFFDYEWIFDKGASILKCENCTHLLWFKKI